MCPGSFEKYEIRLRVDRVAKGPRIRLAEPRSAYEFMQSLAAESSEFMYELLLDGKHQVNGVYLVGKGGMNQCGVDPKDIFKAALVTNSPAFILVHNHPSGLVEPSAEDVALFGRINGGGELLGIQMLDSLIVGDGRYYSFKESGRM